jgi:hypothetical protein
MQIAGARARPVTLKGPDTYHLPAWGAMGDPRRIATLRRIVLEYGRDPRVATLAVQIVRGDRSVWRKRRAMRAEPREYKKQAAALLAWVQTHIYYVNEPGERLQSPEYTLRVGYGDCDDMAILLAAFYESLRLPWKFVLSGGNPRTRQPVRWIEGQPLPPGIKWSHIYVTVGRPTFTPKLWSFAEPTLRGAPLGWDVVAAKQRGESIPLPELGGVDGGDGQVVAIGRKAKSEWDTIRAELSEELHWRRLLVTTVVGSVTSILTAMLISKIMAAQAAKKNQGK